MFKLKDQIYTSQLIIGSGKFSSNALMSEVIEASGAQIVTLTLRRVDIAGDEENILG